MTLAIKAENLHKSYGTKKAVRGISFSIPEGSIYGFLGPNGAGKTSTLRMLLDIIRPDSGSIEILGSRSIATVRGQIGYLPEEKGLYKAMNAESFMTYLATLKGMSESHARRKARASLEEFGLLSYARTKLSALSKGQGQKIQFLAAVLHDPQIVIFDEPFSGLDPVNQQSLEQLIIRLARDGRTIVFSTHVMQHAERLCDQFLLISEGVKVFDGTLGEARKLLSRKASIASFDDASILASMDGIRSLIPHLPGAASGILPNAPRRWDIILEKNIPLHQILSFCMEKHIGIEHFEYAEPSLHDLFMHIVGESTNINGQVPSRS
jgi:ABC-2 type transport system ATP-binding protein